MSPSTSTSTISSSVAGPNQPQQPTPPSGDSTASQQQQQGQRRSVDGSISQHNLNHHRQNHDQRSSRRGSNHGHRARTTPNTSGANSIQSDTGRRRSSLMLSQADSSSTAAEANRLSEKRTSVQSNLSTSNSTSSSLSSSGSINSGSSNRNNSDGGQATAASTMSNIEYENLRNTTLLYFLDRLYRESRDGKEPRTLHELSCLFGTKEFTKEMRQIVGASRNGLKKFLESYPSLFTIEDGKVYVTQLKQDAQKPTRDYDQEACNYFSEKLKQFGTPIVPIKNLFGYRSQASQEIRHVSGRNARDFKQFLLNNDHIFEVLVDEHVVLKSELKELESKGQSDAIVSLREQQNQLNAQDNVMIDPYLNKRFAHLVEDCLRRMENESNNNEADDKNESSGDKIGPKQSTKFELEHLHDRIKQDCSNQLFLKMVKTIDNLKVFLRMHPKLFNRTRCEQDPNKEYVSLLTEEERNEMIKLQSYPTQRLLRQHSTIEGKTDDSSFMSLQPTMNTPEDHKDSSSNVVIEPKQTTDINKVAPSNDVPSTTSQSKKGDSERKPDQPLTKPSPTPDSRDTTCKPAVKQHSSANTVSSQLRSTAPPYVPAQYQVADQKNRLDKHPQTTTAPQPLQRSISSLTSGSRIANDSRQALRNYLLKASESINAETNGSQYNASRNGLALNGNRRYTNMSTAHTLAPAANQHGIITGQAEVGFTTNGDDLRARTVGIVCEAANIISHIMNTTDAVAFDCKGYNLGSDGQITLIQLGYLPNNNLNEEYSIDNNNATRQSVIGKLDNGSTNNNEESPTKKTFRANQAQKPEVCVFDLITNPELAHCLKPLLESNKIIKIVHDVRNKSNALYSKFKIVLKNVFDTQVANLVIQQQETGRPAYKSRYISMSRLCELYGNEELLNYRELIKSKTRHINGNAPINTKHSRNGNGVNDKDINCWRTRPLTKAMIFSATVDVYCLIGGIYHNLKSKIKTEYEPLFEQLNYENVLARIKPEEIKSVKNERKIDLEVIDLKRKLYSDTKNQIVLSNREIRLLRHIELTPEVRQKIQQCKKVAKKLERLDMKAAQMLESMTSQLSTTDHENNGDLDQASLGRTGTTDEHVSSLSLSSVNGGQSDSGNAQRQTASDAEFIDARLSNLMDGSMFDELKDKMIESSSLLESLEDDDNDDTDFKASHKDQERFYRSHDHKTHHSHSDCCNCQCHHRNSADNIADSDPGPANTINATSAPNQTTSKSSLAQTTCDDSTSAQVEATAVNASKSPDVKDTVSASDSKVDSNESKLMTSSLSKAVDMAVQCDLG